MSKNVVSLEEKRNSVQQQENGNVLFYYSPTSMTELDKELCWIITNSWNLDLNILDGLLMGLIYHFPEGHTDVQQQIAEYKMGELMLLHEIVLYKKSMQERGLWQRLKDFLYD